MTLAELLQTLREEAGLTVAELADAGGIAESTMTAILAGEIRRPPDERLRGFARVLDITFEDLLAAIPEELREAAHVPALGVIGKDAVREAFVGDLRHLQNLLQGAVKQALELGGEDEWWPYVHALFADAIVVEMKDGKLLRYPYAVDGTSVSLGRPEEVTITFAAVGEDGAQPAGSFVEAAAGGKYRIRVIRAGLSLNGNFYPDAVLKEAVGLFEGVRVFVKSDAEHLAGGGKDVRNLVGRLTDAAFVEDTGEVQATFELLEPDGDVAAKLKEAWTRGMTGLFGFSIDAAAMAETVVREGRQVRAAKRILRVNSVDLIVEPGAGGEVIALLEARDTMTKGTLMDRSQIIALLEARGLLKGKDATALSDDALVAMLREAVPATAPANPDPAPAGQAVTLDDLRLVEARITARERIAGSKLPEKAKGRLTQRFAEARSFTASDVDQAIKDEAEYLAGFTESGRVTGLGGQRVQITEARFEKVEHMLDAFFDPAHKDHAHARSFKECYAQMTGDTRVTGRISNCDQALMRESLNSASFDDVLGNAIHRRLLADYRVGSQYDIWRNLTGTPVPLSDFRTNERARYGGYGDLPVVAEGDPYTGLASPSDEKASYAATKRGGTEDLTLEMIKNDDVGAITRLPVKLANSAKRTLSKFVLDFLRANPVIYDGITLFHASHGNLGTAALDKASFAARRLAMLKQTEPGSAEQLGIGPRYLWVAPENEETAVDLFRRNTEQDRTFIQSLSPQVMPVWYWTDANDWFVTADAAEVSTVEVGFMDGNEEPELFVQDNPTSGSMFSNDKVSYKIRHVYGAAVVDFRGAQGSLVL